jgi:hypothetical protein
MNTTKHLFNFLSSAVLLLPICFAQEARIPGSISDGKRSKPAPPIELPEYTIKWSKVQYKYGRKVTINRIEPPVVVSKPKIELSAAQVAQRTEEWKTKIKDINEYGGFVMVSATIYDHKATHVRWWHEGEAFEAWSNVDWNHLGGFIGFEARNKRYEMMLVSGNASSQVLQQQNKQGYRITVPQIPALPNLEEKGASYTIIKGDESNEQAMEFIEAIHDLYAAEKPRLIAAFNEREKNHVIWMRKREALRNNPPPKPDLTINFWKRDVEKERREAAEAKQEGGKR